ncbi:hypothetical protein A3K63_03685 [Candidatus Micrarchaeota archaeon RBG_16_49_10]|nr:MAG: hypothetical protein A3K63_03685 [Candidatus Micrarchaeota archaeon RBG_16_49_10]
MLLTEFEKTILLSLFILAKGSTRRSVKLELLLSKFPIRHRKMVKQYLEGLVKGGYLSRKGDSFSINNDALKVISNYLVKGPRARL